MAGAFPRIILNCAIEFVSRDIQNRVRFGPRCMGELDRIALMYVLGHVMPC